MGSQDTAVDLDTTAIWKFRRGLGQTSTLINPYVNVIECANIYTFIHLYIYIYTVNVNYTYLSIAICMFNLCTILAVWDPIQTRLSRSETGTFPTKNSFSRRLKLNIVGSNHDTCVRWSRYIVRMTLKTYLCSKM